MTDLKDTGISLDDDEPTILKMAASIGLFTIILLLAFAPVTRELFHALLKAMQ